MLPYNPVYQLPCFRTWNQYMFIHFKSKAIKFFRTYYVLNRFQFLQTNQNIIQLFPLIHRKSSIFACIQFNNRHAEDLCKQQFSHRHKF